MCSDQNPGGIEPLSSQNIGGVEPPPGCNPLLELQLLGQDHAMPWKRKRNHYFDNDAVSLDLIQQINAFSPTQKNTKTYPI